MAKLTLKQIKAGAISNTSLNSNFDKIEVAVEDTLSRSGLTPNAMEAPLDMNSQRLINLPEPVADSDAARLVDVRNMSGGSSGSGAYADVDLGNVLGDDFVNKAFALQSDVTGNTSVSLMSRLSEQFSINDWTGTFTQKLQAAFDFFATRGRGGVLNFPDGSYTLTAPVTLLQSDVTFQGSGKRTTVITTTYTAGFSINIGDATHKVNETLFKDIGFSGSAGSKIFNVDYSRGTRWYDCYIVADMFARLGDDARSTSLGCYIVDINNCELHQCSNPTFDFLDARNFIGQLTSINSFCEGQFVPGLHGFTCANNIQSSIDHMIILGGYWSRFDNNWNFGKVANLLMSAHHSELAVGHAISFAGNCSFHNVRFDGCNLDSALEQIYVAPTNSSSNYGFQVSDCRGPGGSATRGAVLFDSSAHTGKNSQISIVNYSGEATVSFANTNTLSFVKLIGSDVSPRFDKVFIDKISGESIGAGTFKDIINVSGTANVRVRVGECTGNNIGTSFKTVAAGSATNNVNGAYISTNTLSFGTIAAASTATQTVTISPTGSVKSGDFASISVIGGAPAKAHFTAYVSADNTVTITACNTDPSNTLAVNSITFITKVERYR